MTDDEAKTHIGAVWFVSRHTGLSSWLAGDLCVGPLNVPIKGAAFRAIGTAAIAETEIAKALE
jgi:hypothetical protein